MLVLCLDICYKMTTDIIQVLKTAGFKILYNQFHYYGRNNDVEATESLVEIEGVRGSAVSDSL